MYDLTISIVTYKANQDELLKTINSVLQCSLNYRLYISDNSPDDSLGSLFQDPHIEYIHNEKNWGFGSGHNLVLKQIIETSKYHLVLNPDIYFEKGTLEKIFTFMEENENIGHLMPKVCNPDNSIRKIRRLLPTPLDLYGKIFFPFLSYIKKGESMYRTDFISYDIPVSTPFLSGCFMFFRSAELNRIGLFDERYFLYMEDLDLSRRFFSQSRNIYYPYVSVVHLAQRGSHKSIKLFFLHIKSSIQYFSKWGFLFDFDRRQINHSYRKNSANV